MAQPTTDPIAVEFAGLPDEARAPGGERGGSLEFVNALLRRWRLVVGLPLLAAILTAILSLILPRPYTAIVSFVPEQRTQGRGGGRRRRRSAGRARRPAGHPAGLGPDPVPPFLRRGPEEPRAAGARAAHEVPRSAAGRRGRLAAAARDPRRHGQDRA